jgi:hypothetical protein
MQRIPRPGIFSLSTLITGGILGLLVGTSFVWARTDRAWDHMITGFLWVMLVAVGTGLVRSMRERIGRGEWRRSLAVGCEMTFPSTTMYLLGVALVSWIATATPLLSSANMVTLTEVLRLAPVYYAIALAIALFLGPFCMLTSPYGRVYVQNEQHPREHGPDDA